MNATSTNNKSRSDQYLHTESNLPCRDSKTIKCNDNYGHKINRNNMKSLEDKTKIAKQI